MRLQFIKYFVTGLSGVVLDIGSLYLFKTYLHLLPVTAVIINQFFLLNYIFFLNKYWSFKSIGTTHQQLRRFLLLSTLNYAISVAWMWLLNSHWGVNYLLARLMNIILSVGWNFLLYRGWVYANHAPKPPVYNTPAKTP